MIPQTAFGQRQRAPQRQLTQAVSFGAATQGLLVREGLFTPTAEEGGDAAILLYNLIPGEFGLRTRRGGVDYATNVDGANGEVRSILPYNPSSGAAQQVFACTQDGIFDISAGGAGPFTRVLEWPTKNADSGFCQSVAYNNVTNNNRLLVTDETNGYYVYDGVTWARPPNFTGNPSPSAENIVGIEEYNGRLWLVERGTSTAWYLEPGAIAGASLPIEFGQAFIRGGHLVQLNDWTMDSGDGVNDRLVCISSGGDLIVWQGDPAASIDSPRRFRMDGRWFVGRTPKGRRVLSDWGGDLMAITSKGVQSLTAIVRGEGNNVHDNNTITRNIARLFRERFQQTEGQYGWGLAKVPEDNIALFTTPTIASNPGIQFALSTNSSAWSTFRGLDMLCATKTVLGLLYGTRSGNVGRYIGSIDGTDTPIEFSMLTHYNNAGSPGTWKQIMFLRPYFIGQTPPVVDLVARYDFDLNEIPVLSASAQNTAQADLALWDSAIWDVDIWAGNAQGATSVVGTAGQGRHVAIAMRGQSVSPLTLVGFEGHGLIGGQL